MKNESKESVITFRVQEELKKKIEAIAKKDNRSLSNYLVTLLEKIVKESE
jgi:predicted transcriptional regulator